MAENKDGQEKSEVATRHRLDEGRLRGQTSKSVDVTTSAILLFGGVSVFTLASFYAPLYRDFTSEILSQVAQTEVNYQSLMESIPKLYSFMASILLPLMFLVFFVSLASEIGQVGLKFASKKFSELDDLKKIFKIGAGIKKIFFSPRSLFELVKNFAKILFLGIVIYITISSEFDNIIAIQEKGFDEITPYMMSLALEILIKIGILYLIIAYSDYIFQKWRFSEDMKMTKQEVKDEHKQQEGDPKLKNYLRGLMRARIRRMMIDNVSDADVVITNPTHFAVALKYQQESGEAPIVVAKGADFIAAQIRDKAEEYGIVIYEEAPLARTLFYSVEVDQEIPDNLFKAVAEVLAYVYSIHGDKTKK